MLGIFVVLCGALQHANERVSLLKLGVDGRIILEKYGLMMCLDSFSYRKKNGGCYEIYVGSIGFRRIILRWIFRKWEEVVRTGWSWLRIGIGGRHL